tara:strand:+ start:412 stop:840 length:429 start_codon:yes stop_codon:yes gene_type:complete
MAKDSLISKILDSVFFKHAKNKAGGYTSNVSKLMQLAGNVAQKLNREGVKGSLSGALAQVQILTRMVKAYAKGEYREVSLKSMVSIVAVLIYFISPVDVVPDFLPVIGLTDDVALIMWLIKNLADEIGKFNTWEKNEKTIKI